jgi:DNA polymerase III subunit epsilon
MFSLTKLLSRGGPATPLSEEVREALDVWEKRPVPSLDDVHFYTRYVVLDIISSGMNPSSDKLISIAANTVQRGMILPGDSLFIDFSESENDAAAVNRQLAAFLQFVGKGPLVTYHVPFVGGFLQHVVKTRLGVDFEPPWIDLAWLLPSMFSDKGDGLMPLDNWIEAFGLAAGSGRRGAMENTLMLARVFQMLIVRAAGKGIVTATGLIDESQASIALRRTS